jgi:small subunit ribosomal protein S3
MTEDISKMSGGKQVKIDIVEIKTPELDAQLVAENVALQIERRISFRRAMKKAVQTTMDFGARGIKIRCSGRLGGAEISRAEWYREGKIPLQTLRQAIDYGFSEAMTVYGKIGVKCWVCHPEEGAPERERPERPQRERRDRGDRGGGNRRGPGPAPAAAPAPEAAAAPEETTAPEAEPAAV